MNDPVQKRAQYDEARATKSTLERPKHSRWGIRSLGEVQEIVPILPRHRRGDAMSPRE